MPTEAPRIRGWLTEIERLRSGGFPRFVTSRHPDPDRIGLPVFVYHSIEPAGFEADLRFLSDNGYRTLDADGFHATLTGLRRPRGKEVLLTIDDGRTSAWLRARPLLERYGHRAVLFVIPGCVSDRSRPADEAGGSSDPELMSWDEILAAERSGVLDVQSHTFFHRQVPVGPEVEDFVHPGLDSPFYAVPLPLDVEVDSPDALRRLYGLPLFRSQPLLAAESVYHEAPAVTQAAIDLVSAHPGDTFFRRSGWRRELFAAVRRARESSGSRGRFLQPAELRAAISKELVEARERIAERLDGKRVDHLCLPFGAGSRLAVELAEEAGYKTVFWSWRGDRVLNAVGDDPFHCVRLKHDYVRRLPGRGRRSMGIVLAGKVLRRLRGEAVY